MAEVRVVAERAIDAPAERVYRCLADYQQHHPRFLPPAFSDFRVEAGGVGAGTRIGYTLTLAGRPLSAQAAVTEPEPGRVLAETDRRTGAVTTFTVTPADAGCRLLIETVWQPASGLAGRLEHLLAPRLLRGIYADELDRLDRYAREHPEA